MEKQPFWIRLAKESSTGLSFVVLETRLKPESVTQMKLFNSNVHSSSSSVIELDDNTIRSSVIAQATKPENRLWMQETR